MINDNKDSMTVEGFGDEWNKFDQSSLSSSEHEVMFNNYFSIFPWSDLPPNSVGFDMGCGSGRWAKLVSNRVGSLHCIDPSSALAVAQRNLSSHPNCIFHNAGVSDNCIPDSSMDFGYSLGVLHHVPDTLQGICDCVRLLKPGAPFLLYLYYSFDNRSLLYKFLWSASDFIRFFVSKLPFSLRYFISQVIALLLYWPLARFALLLEYCGLSKDKASLFPLGFYRHLSFYTMRTDALDRFGTRLEKRFSREEIRAMMLSAGLEKIHFSEHAPYWCALGFKK